MPIAKRDSILISISKEVILKYGPDYYREYSQPIIEQSIVPPKGEINPTGLNAGRVIYSVTFLYDKTEETMEWDYAAKVNIWADTWQPAGVNFGNGFGRGIPENVDWRNATPNPMRYHESIIPLYDINNPDPNQEPVNKDELLRRGWKRSNNGQWERTRPDAPPAEAQRAIRRAQEDMRRREAEREKNRDKQD